MGRLRASGEVPFAEKIESLLVELANGIVVVPRSGPGRRPILPAAVLWASLVIGVLRGNMSQLAVWRIVTAKGLWREGLISVADQTVYNRLDVAGPSPIEGLFCYVTAELTARGRIWSDQSLAPFATDVIAMDETTLDPIARSLPSLRDVVPGNDRLLPGKLAGVFGIRDQMWRSVQYIPEPRQNEKVAARDLMATLKPGTLVLADLGYFGFKWFDDLTDAGHFWVSRYRGKTSYRVEQVLYANGTTTERLVWLGAHRSDRAKHLVRMVSFHAGGKERGYFTNVRDPELLSMAEMTNLYARRWDIELAVNLVKRELGLCLLWSAKTNVIMHQIWAVLLIAQILQALRAEIAERAGVDPFEVSMNLLIRYFPGYAARSADPITEFVEDGRRMKFIRPSNRIQTHAPTIPIEQIAVPRPDLQTVQIPRYANRNCGKNRPTK